MMDTVHLMGENGSLVGILSRPPEGCGSGTVAAIMLNSGLLHRVGPYRLYVLLARRLAETGIPVLRIDQSGKGDSARRAELTFDASIRKDFEEAADFLRREMGTQTFILVGLCSGADDGLYISSKYPEISGAVLMEPVSLRTGRFYLRYFGSRLFLLGVRDVLRVWLSRAARSLASTRSNSKDSGETGPQKGWIRAFAGPRATREGYRTIVARDAKLLCVFTSAARYYYNYRGQLKDCLRLRKGREQITELYFPDAKHTYPLARHRNELMEEICNWARSEFGNELSKKQSDAISSGIASEPAASKSQRIGASS